MPFLAFEQVVDGVSPEDWSFFLGYLRDRATQGVETIEGKTYCRTVSHEGVSGLLTLKPLKSHSGLQLRITGAICSRAEHVVARTRAMLDLETDLSAVQKVLEREPHFRQFFEKSSRIRVLGGWSRFELLIRTIVGQQVTVKAATTIMGRIAKRFGSPLDNNSTGDSMFVFPTPEALANGDWDGIGMPARRAATIQRLAKGIQEGQLSFPCDSQTYITAEERNSLRDALLKLPGIGPWTVEYFSLRGLRDPNAWPESDLILKRAVQQLTGETDIRQSKRVGKWEPYRGYAAMLLWNQAQLNSNQELE